MNDVIRLKCKVCQGVIVRSQLHADGRWVHEDDTIVVSNGKLGSVTLYDHAAEPDVIDVLDDMSASKQRHPSSQHIPDPFRRVSLPPQG